jgi:hypothetical protein
VSPVIVTRMSSSPVACSITVSMYILAPLSVTVSMESPASSASACVRRKPRWWRPGFAFDGGYDPVQLSVELAGSGAQIVVRVRDDRTYFARLVPHAGGRGGRPRRHGAKFACADPGTWPTPDVILETDDDVCGRVESRKPRSRPRNGETDDKREA